MVFCGTYSSCLYLLFLSWYKKRRQKKIKASAEAGETGRVHDGNRKRGAFCTFAILGMAFGKAYAIRPYMGSQKIDAFSGNTVGAYCIRPKNVPSMERITQKRDAFSDYTIVISWKIDAFCAFAILGMAFGGTYSSYLYLLFLSWYKKRRQKKIKASAEAGETVRVHNGNKKRDAFGGYVDVISQKRTAFSDYMIIISQKYGAFSDRMIVIT